MRHENIIDYTRTNIPEEYASLDNFIRKWSAEEKKKKICEMFREHGIDIEILKQSQNMSEVETVKRCIEQALPPIEQRKEKPKSKDISL